MLLIYCMLLSEIENKLLWKMAWRPCLQQRQEAFQDELLKWPRLKDTKAFKHNASDNILKDMNQPVPEQTIHTCSNISIASLLFSKKGFLKLPQQQLFMMRCNEKQFPEENCKTQEQQQGFLREVSIFKITAMLSSKK